MPPEDSHAKGELNETEGEIQLLEFLKNIQKYEADMDSSTNEGIQFTRLNILSYSWALQLTDHLAKKHDDKAAPNDVDLTTLYLSKNLANICLRKEKRREESFLDIKYCEKKNFFEEEINDFQGETKTFRGNVSVPCNQEEVKDMCGFIYVFYSIALVFDFYFIKKKFDPEEFINQLSLNHTPEHISPIIQRAIELYQEGELETLKDVHEWLEKNRFECQFNLIEFREKGSKKSIKKKKRLRFYSIEKFTKKMETRRTGSYSEVYEVSFKDTTEGNSGDLCLKEFFELDHYNGRNIRFCFEFTHEYVSKTIGFIVDNHRVAGILFEKLACNFDEIIKKQEESLRRELLLQLALQLSTILTKMHSKGIAYRDLKPENIMVTKIDKDGAFSAKDIRLIDFDNTTYLGQKNTAGVGTDEYRAPEVYIDRNNRLSRTLIEYNKKIDCYSLAMTLYYLMTKRLPYRNWESRKRKFRYTDDSQTERPIKDYYDYVRSYHIQTNEPPELVYDADSYDDIIEIINMGKHADPKKRKTMVEIKRAVEEKLKKLLE